jgi:hypothetical protein
VNGELAQTMAIAAHGTAWLADRAGAPPPDLDATNSTFRFVRSVTWSIGRRDGRGVASWLLDLREQGVDHLWVVIDDDASRGIVPIHNAVAFAGGGTWGMRATGRAGAEVWSPSWELGDREDPEQRIWDVHLVGARSEVAPPVPDLDAARAALVRELTAIRAFAVEQSLDDWAAEFGAALALRDAADAELPYHADIFPDGHPPAARRLASMAARAWVFGGMGSWNDLGFESPAVRQQYDQLSASLYSAVLHALVDATNAR